MTSIKKLVNYMALLLLSLSGAGAASCSKTESYSELLREEENAVNWYLASQKVCINLPEDSISFETGPDAPFYKLDENGYVYMQVINKGDIDPVTGKPSNPVKSGDLVYFRYMRKSIQDLYNGVEADWSGNSDNLLQSTSFVYKNTYLSSTTQYGTGIQMPLKFLGYGSEVNLVLKSYYGFATDQTYCIPFLINIRYFKPEY